MGENDVGGLIFLAILHKIVLILMQRKCNTLHSVAQRNVTIAIKTPNKPKQTTTNNNEQQKGAQDEKRNIISTCFWKSYSD